MSTRTHYAITPEQFVKAWQSSDSVQEATNRLSIIAGKTIPKGIVLARACNYRKRGVTLKYMPRRNPRTLDTAKLNSIQPS